MEGPSEAQWAPDPYRRHELRYWDGTQWTEHVSEGDGSVLVDPPLPGPRTRREAAMASSSGSLSVAPAGLPTASPALSPAPSPEMFPVMAPVVIPAASAPAQTRVGQRSSRPPDLFGELPGGRRAAAAAGAAGSAGIVGAPAAAVSRQADLVFGSGGAPAGPGTTDQEPGGWDWRESHLPEILSGLGVAALIAVAAVLGGGGSGNSADAVQSVVSTPTGAAPAGSAKPAATKKTKKRTSTVPGVQLSSAKAPRITYRSSSSAAPRATTTSRTRTTSPPTSSTPPDANTSTSSTKSQSPTKDTTPTNDSTTSSSSSTPPKKK